MSISHNNVETVSERAAEGRRLTGWTLPLILVVLLAAVLRLYHLNAESMWIDEGYSLRDAMTPFTIAKASKPLYFWFLSWWIGFGDSDWLLRLPSVIFGVASVAMVFVIGRLLWGNKAGTLAAVIAAVSPLQVDHSQEVRMYTLLALTALISIYFSILTLRTWRFRYMLASGLFTWFAMMTHPVASLLLLPQNLAILDAYLHRRRPLTPWIVTQILVLAAWAPWVRYVLGFRDVFDQSWMALAAKPSPAEIPLLWSMFGAGQWVPKENISITHLALFAYTIVVSALIALATWFERRKPETRLIAAWLVLPVAALLLLSIIKTNAWVTRYLIFTSPALYLLLGAMWARQQSRALFIVLGAFLFLIPAGKLARYYKNPSHPPWRQVTDYIENHQQPTDVVAVYRRGNKFVFNHYYDGRAKWLPLGSKTVMKSDLTGWNQERALTVIASVPAAPRRWLVTSMIPMQAEESIDSALRSHYEILDSRVFGSVRVYLYK